MDPDSENTVNHITITNNIAANNMVNYTKSSQNPPYYCLLKCKRLLHSVLKNFSILVFIGPFDSRLIY